MRALKFLLGAATILAIFPLLVEAEVVYDRGRQSRGRPSMPSQVNAVWQQECGSCHLAFPPGLLPAESWRRIMADLEQHFGTDASIPARENEEITAFLVANPSNRWTAQVYPTRITESYWFNVNHRGRKGFIPPEVWQRPAISSAANCPACHLGAATATFDDKRTSIPN